MSKSEIDPSVTQLVSLVKEAQEMNEYDYNKMMSDFEFSTRHQAQLQKIKKKWQNIGKKYDETIQRMKEMREENYKKQNAALIKKLKKKDQVLLTALESTNKEKMSDRRKNVIALMEREKSAREKVERFLIEDEKNRKRFAEQINEKIQLFIERNQKIKDEKHNSVLKKLIDTEMRHTFNLGKLKEENEKIEEENREKAFRKYTAIYWHRKEKEKLHRKKKKELGNKLQEKEERLQELEKQNEKKRKQLLKKLKDYEKKKEEFDKEKLQEREKEKEKRREYYELCQENKIENAKMLQERNEAILEAENMFLSRGANKDNVTDLKRINAGEKIVLAQMTLEKNLQAFKKKMNEIKSNNVMKKNSEQQFAIYKEVKRQEAEKKKKELEDKLLSKQ